MKRHLLFFLPTHKALTFICILLLALGVSAQELRFEPEIKAFEKEDQEMGYKKDFILFTGSSSIRLWHSIEKDMKGFSILNRGFGGSTLTALNKDWHRIAGEHQPDLVVLYCGENDIAEGATVAQTVAAFKTFMEQYQGTFPTTPLIYIAMKPSIDRWKLWDQYQAADVQIKELISTMPQATYIDLSSSMFKKGQLREDIFIEDGLHMNKKGYKGWRKQLRPLLKEKLRQ